MKKIKRKNPKKPLRVIWNDGASVIIPKQSKFSKGWLKKHGCPFVSAYEILQFFGIHKSITSLLSWWTEHFPTYIKGTLTIRGLEKGLKVLLKDKAYVKRFSPKGMTVKRVRKYLDAGAKIIVVRKSPTSMIHYYVLASENGKTYRLDKGRCAKTTVKKELAKKSYNKRYGGMIVVTRKKK
jgi:hypothetical protein